MNNINENLMFVQNIQERENYQVPEMIQNAQPIINNQVPQVQNIEFIQENINDVNLVVNIRNRNNQFYYVWYCLRHGECFLTSTNREPGNRDSRCGVLNECYYDYLGILTLDNGIQFYTEDRIDIRNYFDNHEDGYTVRMFTNMVSCTRRRNEAILY